MILDTNVLVRAVMNDDPIQGSLARKFLAEASIVIVPITVFCEFIWVMHFSYKQQRKELVAAMEAIVGNSLFSFDRPAVEAGLAMLKAGGDFADGVIAFDGARLGGDTFVSFDKKACQLLEQNGVKTLVLA